MNRKDAINRATRFFDDGSFFKLLSNRVAINTSGRTGDIKPRMMAYLEKEMIPTLKNMDFNCEIIENPEEPTAPFLFAGRIEDETWPSILMYGHGDTVPSMEGMWKEGLSPFKLTKDGDLWYGRGTADNKGQHTINLAALECVIKERKQLGFNVKLILEMGEEEGSPGLHAICEREKQFLKADVLIASDGPRIDPETPTVFGGSRGVYNFDLAVRLREGGHHSGNWGGLLANPGIILSHAIASMVDARGKILIQALRPENIPPEIKAAIDKLDVQGRGGPKIDPSWGEPGLSPARKVYGWNTLDVLAFECGTPSEPVNAIPPKAWARCHIRFTADSDPDTFMPAIRKHLDEHNFSMVDIENAANHYGLATRMEPDHPLVKFTLSSFENTLGKKIAFLPNIGGSLPNDAFCHVLQMPTLWVPHSYGGCCQHAPNEHFMGTIARQGLQMMAGLFWDISENHSSLFNKELN